MRLKISPRPTPSRWMVYGSPLLAAVLVVVSGFILFTALGKNPLTALYTFFISPIDDRYGLGELGVKAAPLMLCAIGLAVGFRGGVWNIGAEGQLIAGAICGGGLAIYFNESGGFLLLPAMLIAGALGGMLWAAVPAFLKTRFNANEILVSLMLSYVAVQFLGFLTYGPWRDPQGYNFPESVMFSEAATLPVLLEGTRLHLGLALGLAAVVLVWVLLSRTLLGFQIKVVGNAQGAAAYAGYQRKRVIWIGLLSGGALAGIAGLCEVAGPIGQLLPTISPGYGFAAIIVAFLGRLHPFGIVLASLLMALLYLGGEAAQIELALPQAVTGLFQGMLLFFLLASDVFINFRVRLSSEKA